MEKIPGGEIFAAKTPQDKISMRLNFYVAKILRCEIFTRQNYRAAKFAENYRRQNFSLPDYRRRKFTVAKLPRTQRAVQVLVRGIVRGNFLQIFDTTIND